MQRAVPDTSVVISSFLFPLSTPAQSIRKLEENAAILASEATLAELQEVLFRPKFDRWISAAAKERVMARFTNLVEIVSITELVSACRDAKDDKFLSLAISGKADLILTGDTDLLVLHPFRGIDILSPMDYLSR